MNPFAVSAADLASIPAELLLASAGSVLLLLEAFLPVARRLFTPLAVLATAGALYLAWYRTPSGETFGGLIESTPLIAGFSALLLVAGLISLLAADAYLRRERILAGEYHALFLWALVGLLFMVRARELLTVFIALELLSICLYALAGFHRRIAASSEAAIKYFLMGAFVSSFILMGVALMYGETGSTTFAQIGQALAEGRGSAPLLALSVVLLIAGFGFKMSVVPFHAWAPDVYQGAPSPFVALLSVAPKVASAVVLYRMVEIAAASGVLPKLPSMMAFLAVASMLTGNLLALVQRDIKRMLAYSGIAHMGYLLIPLAAPTPEGWGPVFGYLLAYTFMNAGAFAIVTLLYAKAGDQHPVSNLSGWGYRFPALGLCLTICLLSLAGIPPTAGFLGKYMVFLHAVENGQTWLALVGVLASLLGVFYYLRVIYVLYMRPEVEAPSGLAIGWSGRLAALVAATGSVFFGLLPGRLLAWIADAVARLS